MSEQLPENKALSEEPEVEGHSKAGLTEDPSAFLGAEELDEQEGPEVEGHFKSKSPLDPSVFLEKE